MYIVTRDTERVVKLCGQDAELVNSCVGISYAAGGNAIAAHAVLAEVDGLPRAPAAPLCPDRAAPAQDWGEEDDAYGYDYEPCSSPVYGGYRGSAAGATSAISYNPQDVGRRYLPANGGCIYIDLNHVELAQPESRDAFTAAACWHAMLRTTRDALLLANANRPEESPVEVVVGNTDFQGHSCGSHVNVLVSGACWDSLYRRRLLPLLYYSSFKASAMVIAGLGKVGSENRMPWSPYQIHQRADFLETLVGVQTTYNRPLNNTRSEPLCGGLSHRQYHPRPGAFARVHEIAYDHNLAHTACALKFGTLQLVLGLIEANEITSNFQLEDPLEAVYLFSHDPDLNARAPLCDGRRLTAVELQRCYFEEAARFAAAGGFDGVAPRAADVLALWDETLTLLERRDWPALAARLDWVRKRMILQSVLDRHPELDWTSPQLMAVDHLYSNLDETKGLYWAYERAGGMVRLFDEATVDYLACQPPADTRAWTRAMLLRRLDPAEVRDVDWDSIRVATHAGRRCRVPLDDPLGHTRADTEALFAGADSIDALLDGLGAEPLYPPTRAGAW